MALKDDIALLARVPLFSGLSEEQIRLLAFGAERRRVAAGQTLFRQGAPGDCAFAVASGVIELTTTTSNGTTRRVGEAGAASLLGEMAMISPVERKFTAVAKEMSEVIRIPRPLFIRMLEEYPALADVVRQRIETNLRRTITELSQVSSRLKA